MADAPATTTTTPAIATDVKAALDSLAKVEQAWLDSAGQPNHNPFLRIAQLITPLRNTITAAKVVADDVKKAIAALPPTSPVINPNFVPEVTVRNPVIATAQGPTAGVTPPVS